jgi:hypothetical protein
MFPIQNGLKQGDSLSPLQFNLLTPLGNSRKPVGIEIEG